jgi:hypothetical protein
MLLTCLSLGTLAGCKAKSDAPTEPPALPATAAPAAPAPPTAATTAAAPAPAATADLATSEDYEQQAIDQINPQNIDSELDKLEKEIGQ